MNGMGNGMGKKRDVPESAWRMGVDHDELDGGLGEKENGDAKKKAVRGGSRARNDVFKTGGAREGRRRLSVDDYTVAREVLYLLPDTFLTLYQALFHASLEGGLSGMGERDEVRSELGKASGLNTRGARAGERTSEDTIIQIGGVGKGSRKRSGKGSWVISDERLLAEKERVDRALRKLARQMRNALEDAQGASGSMGKRCGQDDKGRRVRVSVRLPDGSTGLRPGGCWKFVEKEWAYCPFCGFKMQGREERKIEKGKAFGRSGKPVG